MIAAVKTCRECRVEKPLTEFSPRKDAKDGRRNNCRACARARLARWHEEHPGAGAAYSRRWREADPERDAARRLRARCAQFGITVERFEQMHAEQDGRCAMCDVAEEDTGRLLAIDHDHACCPGASSCGRCVRGLLCDLCNRALGYIESPIHTANAIRYLAARQTTTGPG